MELSSAQATTILQFHLLDFGQGSQVDCQHFGGSDQEAVWLLENSDMGKMEDVHL